MNRRQFLSLLPAVPLVGRAPADRFNQPSPSQTAGNLERSGQLSVNGRQLQYQVRGSGRPVVLVGRAARSASDMQPSIASNRLPYQEISYWSPAEDFDTVPQVQAARDLQGLLIALEVCNPVLVSEAHSAATVLAYLKQFGPAQIAGLLFSSVSPQHLQHHHPALVHTPTPTLLTYQEGEVMVPGDYAIQRPLPHVELSILPQTQQHQQPSPMQQPPHLHKEIARFVTSL